MQSLASLSVRAYVNSHPFCADDIPGLKKQYEDLLSCFYGLQVSLDCSKYMSDRTCQLLDLMHLRTHEILQRFHSLNAVETRKCALFLDLEFSRLYRMLNSEFMDFYVPRLHRVLQDLEDCGYDYLGLRFAPKYDLRVNPHDFVKLVYTFPPPSDMNLCNLVTEKTSRIVSGCNETCYERQIYCGLYIDSLDTYYTARSELRGISRSVSLDRTVSDYKAAICVRINAILCTLQYRG